MGIFIRTLCRPSARQGCEASCAKPAVHIRLGAPNSPDGDEIVSAPPAELREEWDLFFNPERVQFFRLLLPSCDESTMQEMMRGTLKKPWYLSFARSVVCAAFCCPANCAQRWVQPALCWLAQQTGRAAPALFRRLRAAGSFFAAQLQAQSTASSPGGSPAGTAHRGRIVQGQSATGPSFPLRSSISILKPCSLTVMSMKPRRDLQPSIRQKRDAPARPESFRLRPRSSWAAAEVF